MNVPILDLDDGLTRLALAKVQQIVCDAAFVGYRGEMPSYVKRHVGIAHGCQYQFMSAWRYQLVDELCDVLEHDELRLWLWEIGMDAYADRVTALVRALMAGEVEPDAGLYTSIMYCKGESHTTRPVDMWHHKHTRSKSGYWGVTHSKWGWIAYISKPRKHIGLYDTAEDAARAYNDYVTERGFDHPLNVIREEAA